MTFSGSNREIALFGTFAVTCIVFLNRLKRYSRSLRQRKGCQFQGALENDNGIEVCELEDSKFEEQKRMAQRGTVLRDQPTSSTVGTAHLTPTAKIFVKTYGCSHNVSDSEFMMGMLSKNGFSIVKTLEEADLCILNSCTVKNPSQEAAVNSVTRAQCMGKKIVVTGCVPQADENIPQLNEVSLVGVSDIGSIVNVVEETLRGNRVVAVGKSSDLPDITEMPKIRRNKLIEIIAVSTGCLGQCTYCKTKHARGELGSYPISSIVTRARSAIAEGVKQIWLTSEDLGAYGIDIGTNIVSLLDALIAEIEASPDVMLRLGMTNPPYMMQHAQAVAKILTHPQVFEFLHVPVQSGSNSVLRDMRREYTSEDFNELVNVLRERIPNITIATDIICGFPNESDEDHQDTIRLIQQHRFPVINISQFYPRPGTPAAHMPRVPTKIAKARSGQVTKLFESYTNNDHLRDQIVKVWFDYPGDNDSPTQSVGHTKNYIKVILPFSTELPGTSRLVRVTSTHKWDVRGIVID
jgi:threonylcarbamoyladenosine tRNA methylthiotransferase CDKAL1